MEFFEVILKVISKVISKVTFKETFNVFHLHHRILHHTHIQFLIDLCPIKRLSSFPLLMARLFVTVLEHFNID
jgi:hypothetical protein